MNQIKVNQQETIVALHQQGWSKRRIARELRVDRVTVRRYLASTETSKSPANPQAGSSTSADVGLELPDSNSPTPRTGFESEPDSKSPANPRTGSGNGLVELAGGGPDSLCEPWKERIEAALASGLSIQRIHQDLVSDCQFGGSYDSVWRFTRRLGKSMELPFRRMEVEPGAEAQVDFGQGAFVVEDGKRRRPHLFRVVLSHSRKGYSEVVWHQTTENFIRCLENAFRSFGGVTRRVVIDNLRAAVKRVDWFEPELNPKVSEFCRYYGIVILPTKPAMPRHKGKVEAGVKYAQNNALAGRQFGSLAEQNLALIQWEEHTADTRIHGTTKQQVGRIFREIEKSHLLALPAGLFPCFEEGQRTVHRDGHIELQQAYYSVPPEYMGRRVWVRWESRLVRIFNQRMEQIAVHTRHEPGRFATQAAHIHDHKRMIIERGADWLLDRARLIGKYSGTWAQEMFAQRGVEGIRSLQGLLALAEKHPVIELEHACKLGVEHGVWRLHDLRELLTRAGSRQLTFLETHPLIRSLDAYDKLVPVCFTTETQTRIEPENNA